MNGWRELRFPVDSLKKQVLVVEDDRGSVLADPLGGKSSRPSETGSRWRSFRRAWKLPIPGCCTT